MRLQPDKLLLSLLIEVNPISDSILPWLRPLPPAHRGEEKPPDEARGGRQAHVQAHQHVAHDLAEQLPAVAIVLNKIQFVRGCTDTQVIAHLDSEQ